MKKKSLLNFWLLLLCMIAGAGTAWGDETLTIDFESGTSAYTDWTFNNMTSQNTNSGVSAHGGSYFGTTGGKATASLQTKEKIAAPKSIKFYVSKQSTNTTACSWYVRVSSNGDDWTNVGDAQSASSMSKGTWVEVTRDLSKYENVYVQIYYTNNTAVRCIDDVTLTYSSDDPSLSDNDLALTGAPVALNFDLYDNTSAQVIHYTTSCTGAISIDDSDYANFVIDEENKTITVTPKAVTPSAQTITVNQAADETYKAGSATFTVTITDSTPIPTHIATFSVNGVTSTSEFEEGADIVFPDNPSDVSGKIFMGWVTEAIDGTTDEAPEFVTSAVMGDADITYYAVFAEEVEGEPKETLSQTLQYDTWTYSGSTTDKSSYRLFGNGSYVESASFDLSKLSTVKIFGGTYGGTDTYKTVTIGDGTNVWKEVTMTGTNNSREHSFTDGTSLTGNKPLRVISTCGNGTNSGIRMSKIEIYILVPSVGYSNYCTTFVAAAVEKPVITVAENPFMFSTTATITCATDGAAIKYSYDGENWSNYTAALTITATTTIYAKAVKDENESKVVSVTATKNLAVPTVTIDATGITNTNVFEGTEAGSLSATVTYNEEAVEGAAVTWNGNNDEVATINASTGTVTLVAAGSVTFTATYAGNGDYSEKTATYEMTVTNSDPNAPGTENNPYTVEQAKYAIDNDGNVTDVYVGGIVSQVDTYNSKYNSITYWISDDGTTTNQFEVYSGKGIGGADFSSKDDIQVGDVVVVKGNITLYNSTIYEFSANNQLVSLVRKISTPTFSPEAGVVVAGTEVTISCAIDDVTIYYTTDGSTPTTESTEYTEAITIDATTTINAIAVKDGWADSDVASVTYTVAAQVATPTFSPAAGTYTSVQNVEISTETEDATIYYTTDGTTPTEESTEYTSAINVDETMTIKAIAVKDGMVNSEVASATFTINVPSIVVAESSVDAPAAVTEGTINVTYNFIASDPAIVWYTDNTCAETIEMPNWIVVDFDGSHNIEYVVEANTGEARTAYLKVYGLDSEANDVYSNLITISQAEYVAPTTYTLVTSITPGKHYLIGNGNVVMGAQNTNNRTAVTVTAKGNVLEVTQDDEVAEFVIYGPDANGYYTIYDTEAEGYLYAASSSSNYLKTQATNNDNGKWSISIDNGGEATVIAQGSNTRKYMRFNSSLFSCYAENSSVKDLVSFYEKDGEATPTVDVTLAASGYASYCSPLALDLTPTEDYAAWAVTDATSSTVTFTKITGAVPAETPFILYGKEFGDQTATLSVATGETTAVSNNMLVGTLKPTAVTTVNGNYTNFALSGGVFVKMSNGTVPANKAYLPILTSVISSSSRLSIVFNDETTGISEVKEVTNVRGEYYNLNGQRVENLKKGNLYIVNGKKILVK